MPTYRTMNEDFTAWLTQRATKFAKGVSFDNDLLKQAESLKDFQQKHPEHYPAGIAWARQLIPTNPEDARRELERLIGLFPDDDHPEGARILLSQLLRQQQELPEEAAVLKDHLKLTADDITSATRLFDISIETGDFAQAVAIGRTILAIDPARPAILRSLVDAAVSANDTQFAVQCLRALIELDPSQTPRWRLRIARLMQPTNLTEARRQTLLALEETPRYREAHRFLLQLEHDDSQKK